MTPEELIDKYLTEDYRLKGEYVQEDGERSRVLARAEKYAGWTLPIMFPTDNITDDEEVQHDFQSIGAQCVTNLANKIMLALFQPSRPFFRIQLTPEQREELTIGGLSEAAVDAALAGAERAAMAELNKRNARVEMTTLVTQLIITGNAMLHMPKDGMLQVYSMRDYTVSRDLRGTVTKIIIEEIKKVSSLPNNLAKLAKDNNYEEETEISIYTGIMLTSTGKYLVWQEMEDICYCHEKVGVYTEDTLPWIVQTWNLIRGKDYGTGLVENYAGDFATLSTLAEAIVDFTIVATDVKNLVNPAGMTDVREITEAPTGAYVYGREEDLFVHTASTMNAADFLISQSQAIERRLGAAFLLNSSVTRDAERVTAEEIRLQAQELEGSLGGVYSRLATFLQQPLAKRLLSQLDPLFKGVEPLVVTGLESLSRNSELDRTRAFFGDLIQLATVPEQVNQRIDFGKLIAVLGAGHGVDYDKFLKPDDQVEAEAKARAKAEAAAVGMQEQAKQQGQQPNV